jgi:glycerol-3-phosphate acyltransferase PlsY
MSLSKISAELMFSGLLIFAYLLGSIPWGLILTRAFAGDDIRQKGSGNIGATNVSRQAGVIPGLLTLAGDIFKGAVPVYLALLVWGPIDGSGAAYVSLVLLAAFSGHLYPIYLRFRDGGKGVATAAGCFAVLSPAAVLAAGGVFLAVLVLSRRVSVGSLSAAAVLPFAIWIDADSAILAASAVIVALFIFLRHWNNLKRLLAGKEPQFRLKREDSKHQIK